MLHHLLVYILFGEYLLLDYYLYLHPCKLEIFLLKLFL